MFEEVTLVLTSCNRLDLLDRTLASIGDEVLDSIKHKIIIDDSGDPSVRDYFTKYKTQDGWRILLNKDNLGQPKSVDKAYSLVDTPYIFHCEDDWHFASVPLEECLDVLNTRKDILQVTFRQGCPHLEGVLETTPKGTNYRVKVPGWRSQWYGFTYNPSIFRKEAYEKVKPYSGKLEEDISKLYYDKGYLSASLQNKTYHHIGDGRGTESYKIL